MSTILIQTTPSRPLVFLMVDATNHIGGKTGLTPTVTIRKAGAPWAAPAGVISELGNGLYQVAGNATDTDTLGPLLLHATAPGADPSDYVFYVEAPPSSGSGSTDLAAVKAKTDQLAFVGGRVSSYVGDFDGALAPDPAPAAEIDPAAIVAAIKADPEVARMLALGAAVAALVQALGTLVTAVTPGEGA